jgi:hypothetical protein
MSTITPAATMPISAGSDFDISPAYYSGEFIPALWSGQLNAKFFAASTFAAVANTNWEGEISSMGDKVIIQNPPSISINDYQVGMTLSYEVPEPDSIELAIDQGKYFGFQLNDVLAYQADYDLMNIFSDDAGQQLKVQIDTNCWAGTFDQGAAANKGATAGVITGAYDLGTDAAPITLTKDNILTTILAMASVMDEQNVPEEGRFLVITPRERYLLMQSSLAQAYYTGDSASPLRNGKLGMIDRFQLYVSNLLPTGAADEDWEGGSDAGTAARHAVIAGHSSALTFANQVNKTETLRNPNDFGDVVRGLTVFGRKVVKPEALALLVAAG